MSTVVGVQPELPETVALDYGDAQLGAPVRWEAIDPADLAAAGTFTVRGFAEGYAAGAVEATVTVLGEDPWHTNLATTGTAQAEFTAAWNSLAALNDGAIAYTGGTDDRVWATWSDDRPATRWAGYEWAEPVRVDEVVAHFWSDQPGPDAGDGVAVPQSWAVQALVDGEWRDVSDAGAYPTEREAPNRVSFDPVVTTGIRVALTAQSDGSTNAGVGLSELEVFGEPLDTVAPSVALTLDGVDGAGDGGSHRSPFGRRRPMTAIFARGSNSRSATASGVASDNVRFAEASVGGDGEHVVQARATDAAGNTSAEASVIVRIDATKPDRDRPARRRGPLGRGDHGRCGIRCGGRRVRRRRADGLDGLLRPDHGRRGAPRGVPAGPGCGRQRLGRRLGHRAPVDDRTARRQHRAHRHRDGLVHFAVERRHGRERRVDDRRVVGHVAQVGEQWVQLEWDRIVTVDRAGVLFFRDSPDESGVGMIPPSSWVLQYVDLATGEWRDVETNDAYGRSSDALNEVTFAAVTTTKLRAVMQAWGAAEARRLQRNPRVRGLGRRGRGAGCHGADRDPSCRATSPGRAAGTVEPVQMVAAATDDRDPAPSHRAAGRRRRMDGRRRAVRRVGRRLACGRGAGDGCRGQRLGADRRRRSHRQHRARDRRSRWMPRSGSSWRRPTRSQASHASRYSTRKNKQPTPGVDRVRGPIDVDGKTVLFVRAIDAAGNVSDVHEFTRKQLG